MAKVSPILTSDREFDHRLGYGVPLILMTSILLLNMLVFLMTTICSKKLQSITLIK